jgi:hypothetical protein
MPDPTSASMFEHVYGVPHAALEEQAEQFAAYLDSFTDRHA